MKDERITVLLPKGLKKAVKSVAVERECYIKDVIIDALLDYLESSIPKSVRDKFKKT